MGRQWLMDKPGDAAPDYRPKEKEGEWTDSAGDRNRLTFNSFFQLEVLYSYLNHAPLLNEHRLGTAVDANTLAGKDKGPALILGSGPSLDKIMPRLAEWKGPVFTSTTQATTCVYYGKDPTFIVVMDVSTRKEELEPVDNWEGRDSSLCCHPSLRPDFLDFWKNRKIMYRLMNPEERFYTDVMTAAYPWITSYVLTFAHTMPTQAALANMMGYSPLILCGCDLGYPGGKLRFTRARFLEEVPVYTGPTYFDERQHVISDNGIVTDRSFLFYKMALYCVWRLDRSQMLSASDGILHEMPHVEPDEVIDRQGRGFESLFLPRQEIEDRAERYMAKKNTYAIPVGAGCKLAEVMDWRAGLPQVMGNMIAGGATQVNPDAVMERVAWLRGESRDRPDVTERAL